MKITLRHVLIFTVLVVCVQDCAWSGAPKPADVHCLPIGKADGRLVPLDITPKHIYGIGLTYSIHIKETGSKFDSNTPPPIFRKNAKAWNPTGAPVKYPSRADIIATLERIEPGLGGKVDKKFKRLPLLLDYEVELALVLLEDVDRRKLDDPAYVPKLGYFIANDLSARIIAVLGEGRPNRYEYWGASKSFRGFLPVGGQMWVPSKAEANSLFCTTLKTTVNGRIRQEQPTTDLIYTPKQMLRFIARKYPKDPLEKGDVILTGTPGGSAMKIPAWKTRLAGILGMGRFKKLNSVINANHDNPQFLQPGDEVTVSAAILGKAKVIITK